MKKLNTRIALVVAIIGLAIAPPAFAHADDHPSNSGPKPLAAIGSVFGGAMWLVSVPFSVLLAPTHVMDSFDTLVVAPWRTAIGAD